MGDVGSDSVVHARHRVYDLHEGVLGSNRSLARNSKREYPLGHDFCVASSHKMALSDIARPKPMCCTITTESNVTGEEAVWTLMTTSETFPGTPRLRSCPKRFATFHGSVRTKLMSRICQWDEGHRRSPTTLQSWPKICDSLMFSGHIWSSVVLNHNFVSPASHNWLWGILTVALAGARAIVKAVQMAIKATGRRFDF